MVLEYFARMHWQIPFQNSKLGPPEVSENLHISLGFSISRNVFAKRGKQNSWDFLKIFANISASPTRAELCSNVEVQSCSQPCSWDQFYIDLPGMGESSVWRREEAEPHKSCKDPFLPSSRVNNLKFVYASGYKPSQEGEGMDWPSPSPCPASLHLASLRAPCKHHKQPGSNGHPSTGTSQHFLVPSS